MNNTEEFLRYRQSKSQYHTYPISHHDSSYKLVTFMVIIAIFAGAVVLPLSLGMMCSSGAEEQSQYLERINMAPSFLVTDADGVKVRIEPKPVTTNIASETYEKVIVVTSVEEEYDI